ncbi:MAG: hypothetical protein HY796_05900 [Elusimicrobia bacterium]|nr:hypothetical protein [Elusimicrobiota bacterium]
MNKLISQLQSSNPEIVRQAEKKLIKAVDLKYVAPLLSLYLSGNTGLTVVISRYRKHYGRINRLLIRKFKTSKRKHTREMAIWGLNDFLEKSSAPFLKKIARKRVYLGFRTPALYALSNILLYEAPETEDDVYELFVDAINDRTTQIRAAGFTGLSHMRHHDTRELLARAFKDPDHLIRCNALDWEAMRRGIYSGTKKA